MRRKLNLKAAVCLLALVLIGGLGVHLLHGYQVKRNAGNWLARTDRAEEEGNLNEAVDYLERYLVLAPDDVDAQARLGVLLDRAATTPQGRLRAFFVLERVVRTAPQRHEERRRLARLALAVYRPTDAQDHLNVLLQECPEDGELEELQGQCAVATAQFARAAEWYERASRHGPERVECYVQRARLLRRRLNRAEEADQVMEQLVAANPRSAPAFLAHGRYAGEFLSLDKASAPIARARALAPDDAEVLLASADLELARRQLEEARGYLQRGTQLHADDVRFWHTLARLELHAGKRDRAAEHLRRTLTVNSEKPLALWTTADLFIDTREYSEARGLLARLEKTSLSPALLDYLRARLLIGDEQWGEARRLLERARPGLNAQSDLLKQTYGLLALCHQRLGNPDLEVAAYRSALDIDASWLPARLGLAAATVALGRTDEGATLYEKLASQAPTARLSAARLQIMRNLRLPREQRRWAQAERLLNDAPESLRKTPEWGILWAEILVAQERIHVAEGWLETLIEEQPGQIELRTALAAVALRQKRLDQATEILDQAESDIGDSVELRLTRAAALGDKPSKDIHASLQRLAANADKFTRQEQVGLLQGLIRAAVRADDQTLVKQFTARLLQVDANHLDAHLFLLRLALQERDAAACQRLVTEFRRIEGEDGVLWRYAEAARRLRFAAADDKAALADARTRLAEAAKVRPSWAPIALLEAELCEREGNMEGAIEKYRQAVALGNRQPPVVRRVVQLLNERRRYSEAQEVLNKLQEQTPLSGDLVRVAAEVSLLSHAVPEQTLELARRAVSKDAKDYRNLLWLGQILSALNQKEEAEQALRRAVELAGDVPETWVSLILFLARTEQKEAAEKAMQEAQKKLPPAKASLPFAICWEALGQRDKALEQYRAALAAQPDDPAALRLLAVFHMRTGHPAEAQQPLRKLAAASDSGAASWARRNLALALAMVGGYPQAQEALGLIDQNLKQPNPALEDQRVRALVLAVQPNRRRDSIRALEESFTRLPASTEEQFLLGRLYEADRNWTKARGQFLPLVSRAENPNPMVVAYYIDALLRQKETDEAQHWLQRLEKLEPQSWRTTQLKARILTEKGRGAEAERLLLAYKGAEAGLPVAFTLEGLGQRGAAERVYRQVAAAEPPENALALAAFLGRRGKPEEALDVCDRAAAKCAPETIATLNVAIARNSHTDAVVRRVDKSLAAALQKKPESPVMLLALADLRDLQGRFGDAQTLYRQLVKDDPKNAVALNNLSVLLSLQQKAPEALELSNKAIELTGPAPFLLDTRAVAYLALGQAERAVSDLEEAVALHPTAPRYFHLSQAYRATRNSTAAALAYQKAKGLGLTAQVLHPLERAEFEKFKADHEER